MRLTSHDSKGTLVSPCFFPSAMNPLLVGSLLACLLTSCARGEPKAVLPNTSVDFGSVMQGSPAAPEFVVKNEGTGVLQIQRINITAPIKVLATKMPAQIAPGEQAAIQLNFDTWKIEGPVEGEIVLFLNDPASPEVRLSLAGRVVPPIEFSPMPALFVTVGRGERAQSSLEIINHGPQPLHIETIEHATDRFTTTLDTIEGGKRYKLNLFLNGAGPAGLRKDPITIRTSSPARPEITIPANTLIRERVYTFPEEVDLGSIPIGQWTAAGAADRLAQTLMAYQTGGTGFAARFSSDLPELQIRAEKGPKGDRWQATVTLAPSRVRVGPLRGTITIDTNDPQFPTLRVPVTGFVSD